MHHFGRSKPPQASHMSHEFDIEVSKVIPVFHSTIPFQWNSPLIMGMQLGLGLSGFCQHKFWHIRLAMA